METQNNQVEGCIGVVTGFLRAKIPKPLPMEVTSVELLKYFLEILKTAKFEDLYSLYKSSWVSTDCVTSPKFMTEPVSEWKCPFAELDNNFSLQSPVSKFDLGNWESPSCDPSQISFKFQEKASRNFDTEKRFLPLKEIENEIVMIDQELSQLGMDLGEKKSKDEIVAVPKLEDYRYSKCFGMRGDNWV